MTRHLVAVFAAIFFFAASQATAQMRGIDNGAFTGADNGHAYILYHILEAKPALPLQPIFMQMPTGDGGSQENRLYAVRNGHAFAKTAAGREYLIEVTPGDYLIYGLSMSAAEPALTTCFCLGTVSFHARAGVITDIGGILTADARSLSAFPELATESGFGPSIDTGLAHPVGGIRPDPSDVGPTLGGTTIEQAKFRAVGRFFDPRTYYVDRLAPMQGVLRYDNGRPIDLLTGAPLQDHFAE